MSTRRVFSLAGALGGVMSLVAGLPVAAQSVAARVTANDGPVQIVYPSRPSACGDGESFIGHVFGANQISSSDVTWSGGNRWEVRQCIHGPARLVLTVTDGEITRARAYVGPVPSSSSAIRTITLTAAEATAWLSDVVARSGSRAASQMILPLVLADGPEPWPLLLKVARDENRPRDLRRNVMTWLSNGVSEHLGLLDASDSKTDDDEMRDQAIYVLTQRPKSESVPQLIELARSLKYPSGRRTAIYWLGQTGDPRAVDVYAELLGLR